MLKLQLLIHMLTSSIWQDTCFKMVIVLSGSRLIELKRLPTVAQSCMCSNQTYEKGSHIFLSQHNSAENLSRLPRQAFCHHWLNQCEQLSVGHSGCVFARSVIKLPVSTRNMFEAFIGKCIKLSGRPTTFSLLTLKSDPWHRWACLQVACLNKASTLNKYTKWTRCGCDQAV